MESDRMNDMARWWSFLDRRNYFFKEGQWCENLAKTSILEVKLRISEIHLQQQIHDTGEERLKNDYWVLYNPDLTLLWSQSHKWNVYIFGWKSVFLWKIIQFFVIRQVKFLKFIVFIYLILNLMLPYSTYIYHVVFNCKTC